ncbi:MAG: recombinase [Candidatus Peribacteria bacterium]|nr:recombinase [Candidatus Peribacteria bacterium]
MNFDKLKEQFSAEDVEWRIGRAGYTFNGKLYATALAYITNRAIMNRLDQVCGPENWRNEFREWHVGSRHGVLCGLSIRINNEWVTKWDAAENTDIEPVKGGISDSMKRAGVQWGIGRYLYDLTEGFAIIQSDGQYYAQGKDKLSGKEYRFRWNAPQLPEWALPKAKFIAATAKVRSPRKKIIKDPAVQNKAIEQEPVAKS